VLRVLRVLRALIEHPEAERDAARGGTVEQRGKRYALARRNVRVAVPSGIAVRVYGQASRVVCRWNVRFARALPNATP
jgi:hypothetical protein